MMSAVPSQDQPATTWPAALALRLEGGERGTRLASLHHSGPLYVQKPFYPEGKQYAHVYLLHPPGGIVSGDSLAINVSVANSAHLLMTTPGAARAYRARDTLALQQQKIGISIADNSSVEYFPLETIVHDGARLNLYTRVELQSDCVLALWDIACFGLPASNSPFLAGSLEQKFEIISDARPIFIDRLVVNAENRVAAARCGLAGQPVTGFFVAGPLPQKRATSYLDQARECIERLDGSHEVAITSLNGFCIARYLGASAAQARRYFTALWSLARPMLLGRAASMPRIWYT